MAYTRTNKRKAIKKFVRKSFTRKRYIKKRRIPLGFPTQTVVRLKYCDQISLNVTAAPQTYVFAANSIYDPNVSGIGHQPGCFDTYASIYNHYTVLGSKITCKFFPTTTTDNFQAVVGVKLDDDATITPVTEMTTLIEQPSNLYRWKVLRTNALASNSATTVVHKYSAKKFFGVKDVKDNALHLGALTGSSPTESANFIVCAGTTSEDVDLPVIQVIVTIEYIVHFSELKDIIKS